jgi:protein-S-isoprenylcysteine O-methyltransferase Ste14
MDTRRTTDHRWAFPPDLMFALGIPIVLVAVLTGWFLELLLGARGGEPVLFWIALIIGVLGLCLLFAAHLPLYRQGRFFSICASQLAGRSRLLYHWAYCLIVLSLVLMVALLLIL